MNFDFKKITDFGKINMDNVSDTFKNPGSGINASSIRTPSPDDLTTIFTDIKVAAMEFLESMISGAKKSTLGASFMENASQIIGLAVVILGFVLYIQIQVGNEQAEGGRRENKYATSIVDDIDVDKPSNKISKKINIELFTPKGDNDGGGKSVNPHEPPELARRSPKSGTASISSLGSTIEETVKTAIGKTIPNGPSDLLRKELKQKAADCKTSDTFCKTNHADLQKVCSNIKNQDRCAEKCCCGWVKFTNEGVESDKPGSGVMHSLGISPDGKCVAGNDEGPALVLGRDIDYYYYMGECMKGICKPKGT